MPDPDRLALFVAATLALLVVPGPAVLYIVTQSVDHGRRAGIVSTVGIHVGSLVHVVAASIGLSALLVSSATAFEVVKYVGAVYIVALGLRRLLARDGGGAAEPRPRQLRRIFAQGIVVNVLNPKTALFFFAFLPQFVDVDAGHVGMQMAFLGLLFIALGFVSDGTWAVAAGTAGRWLRRSARARHAQPYASGGTLVGIGVLAALTGSRAQT